MKYEVIIIHDLEDLEGDLTREKIIEVETDYIDQLDRDFGISIQNVRVDVKEFPRERGSELQHETPQEDWAETGGPALIPHGEVTHPWDQGMNIFPDDHPLYALEQAVKKLHKKDVKEELFRLRRLELNQGEEVDREWHERTQGGEQDET